MGNEAEQVQPNMAEAEQRYMAELPDVLRWTVAGVGDHGPVTMSLQLPHVTITDAAGRSIVVAPQQAEIVGTRLAGIPEYILELTETDDQLQR